MDAMLAASLVEALKFGLIAMLIQARRQGATPEQIEAGFQAAYKTFLENDPAKIPD